VLVRAGESGGISQQKGDNGERNQPTHRATSGLSSLQHTAVWVLAPSAAPLSVPGQDAGPTHRGRPPERRGRRDAGREENDGRRHRNREEPAPGARVGAENARLAGLPPVAVSGGIIVSRRGLSGSFVAPGP